MKEFAKEFYSSNEWKACRASYKKSVGGLCEICLAKGLIVPADIIHHKIELSPSNINDPSITLQWSNLQAVCLGCHAQIHLARQKRYKVDELGRVTT